MQRNGFPGRGIAPRAGYLRSALVQFGFAAALMLALGGAFTPNAAADSTDPAPPTAGASNGGVGSTTSSGAVTIEQIVTGENTGNSIVTGDIVGSAEINGGEIAYPTVVNVSLDVGPQIVDASGGDGGEATAEADADAANGVKADPKTDISIVNRNNNRSSATVTE